MIQGRLKRIRTRGGSKHAGRQNSSVGDAIAVCGCVGATVTRPTRQQRLAKHDPTQKRGEVRHRQQRRSRHMACTQYRIDGERCYPALVMPETDQVVYVSEVQQLLGLDQTPEIWGSHGRERRLPDGTMISIPIDQGAVDALNAARAAVVQHQFSERMEDKISSIALHWRGLPDTLRQGIQTTMQAAWEPIATTYGLEIHDFDNGMELRVPGRNKGDAVTTILSEVEPQAAAAYLGDDLTDEDACIALHQHAKVIPAMSTHPWYLTVLVRKEHRETRQIYGYDLPRSC